MLPTFVSFTDSWIHRMLLILLFSSAKINTKNSANNSVCFCQLNTKNAAHPSVCFCQLNSFPSCQLNTRDAANPSVRFRRLSTPYVANPGNPIPHSMLPNLSYCQLDKQDAVNLSIHYARWIDRKLPNFFLLLGKAQDVANIWIPTSR